MVPDVLTQSRERRKERWLKMERGHSASFAPLRETVRAVTGASNREANWLAAAVTTYSRKPRRPQKNLG